MAAALGTYLKQFSAGTDSLVEGVLRRAVSEGGFTSVLHEVQRQMDQQPLVAWGARRFMSSQVQKMFPSAHVRGEGDWLHIAMPGGFLPQIVAGGFMQLVSSLTGAAEGAEQPFDTTKFSTLFHSLQQEIAPDKRYAEAKVIGQASELLDRRMQEAGLKPLEQRAVRRSFDEVTAALAQQPAQGTLYSAEEVLQLVEQRAVKLMQELDQRLPAVRFAPGGPGQPMRLSVDIPTLLLQLTQRLDTSPEMPVILQDLEKGLDARQPGVSVPTVLAGVFGAHAQPLAQAALTLLQPAEKQQAVAAALPDSAKAEASSPSSVHATRDVVKLAAAEQQTVALNLQTVAAVTEYLKAQEAAKAF